MESDYAKTQHTTCVILADGKEFHLAGQILINASCVIKAFLENNDEGKIELKFSAKHVDTWLKTFYIDEKKRVPITIGILSTVMPMFLYFHMDKYLHKCYDCLRECKQLTTSIVNLIFETKPFRHMEPYILNKLINCKLDDAFLGSLRDSVKCKIITRFQYYIQRQLTPNS
jgi:hypothetical protein